jgi:hypothetical protein
MLLLIDNSKRVTEQKLIEKNSTVVFMDLRNPLDSRNNSIGQGGTGRVGFQKGSGEGSGPSRVLAQGGGGGGNRTPMPTQTGKLPPP